MQLAGDRRISKAEFGGHRCLPISALISIFFVLLFAFGGQAEAQLANRALPTPGFANGDLGTGLALGISLTELQFWALETTALSVSYEYNISSPETDISIDLTTGISF